MQSSVRALAAVPSYTISARDKKSNNTQYIKKHHAHKNNKTLTYYLSMFVANFLRLFPFSGVAIPWIMSCSAVYAYRLRESCYFIIRAPIRLNRSCLSRSSDFTCPRTADWLLKLVNCVIDAVNWCSDFTSISSLMVRCACGMRIVLKRSNNSYKLNTLEIIDLYKK